MKLWWPGATGQGSGELLNNKYVSVLQGGSDLLYNTKLIITRLCLYT